MTPLDEMIQYMADSYGIKLDKEDILRISNQVVDRKEYKIVIEMIETMIFAADKYK